MLNWIVWNRTVYMYKMDLAFNNLQWLICHKTKPNQTIVHRGLNGNQWEQDGDFIFWRWKFLTNWPTYSNSRIILVIWLKPSNESRGLRLIPTLTVVHQTDWLLFFSISKLTWMLHNTSKINLTDFFCNNLNDSKFP